MMPFRLDHNNIDSGSDYHCHVQDKKNNKHQEIAVIIIPHTIVKVWTVVVKSFNTFVADISMPTPWCPDDFAVRTDIVSVCVVQ